jgi:hypothetical protein
VPPVTQAFAGQTEMFYELIPKKNQFHNWLFRIDDNNEKLSYRAEYDHLKCKRCGKIDELKALDLHIPQNMIIQGDWSFIGLKDDFGFAVDGKVVKIIQDNNISGLRFIPFPGDKNHYLLLPTCFMPINETKSGFEYRGGKCDTCGRYREVTVGPLIESIEKPNDPNAIFTGERFSENIIGRRINLFCTNNMAKILMDNNISGLEILEAL